MNVTIHIDNSITVVDNGRGIPATCTRAAGRRWKSLTVLHAGGKFDNDAYKVSGGLHGVGVSVVNALSETLDLEIWRNGRVTSRATSAVGPERSADDRHDETPRDQDSVQADQQVFETIAFSFDTLAQRLRELAFLNGGVTITLEDERDEGKSHQATTRAVSASSSHT